MARVTVQEVLTQEQVNQYVRTTGARCPWCGSKYLETGDMEPCEGFIVQSVICTCGREWNDVFRLAAIAPFDPDGDAPELEAQPAGPDYKALAEKLAEELKACATRFADILDNCLFPPYGEKARLTPEQQAWREKIRAWKKAARAALADYLAAVTPPDEHPGWERLETALERK